MQRINSITNPEGKAKDLLDGVQKKLGSVPNIFKAFANAPAALEGYLNFNDALSGGILTPQIREQIALTVAGLNGCDYCASAHTFMGDKAGVNKDELAENLQGRSSDDKTQAALTLAKRLVEARGSVSESDIKVTRDAGFSDEEIVEIIAHVALNTFTNYFNEAFKTDVDFPTVTTNEARQAA